MKAKNFIIYQSSQREIVEGISEVPPDIRISILPATLVVKPVDLRDLSSFMISS